ncbi:GlxA family transcriptional regulator [Chitinophaga pinensis]|uniref:GlxA family transcriptional regulator n=1 Tax=Chitinophaga pinensis TaxID=79329 RepID=UPI001C99106B|nr:DJ-1/PfpI family protein [Chitinophaga pinensis]
MILSGIPADDEQPLHHNLLPWIATQANLVRRIGSVCSGSFMLAQAGVLNGKRATTHWRLCQKMKEKYPEVLVEHTPVFVKDGHIYTSAGVTTGMDLALALTEEDMGRTFALDIARQMVLFLKRPGNQSQYSTMLAAQATDYTPINNALSWLQTHLHEAITVERLAQEAAMSPRNFARLFVQELHITPARYIEKLRVELACRSLTEKKLTSQKLLYKVVLGMQTICARSSCGSWKQHPPNTENGSKAHYTPNSVNLTLRRPPAYPANLLAGFTASFPPFAAILTLIFPG